MAKNCNLVRAANKKFWRKYKDIMKKFDVNVHDHIQHGISLPLNCIKQLNRFISKR